MKNKQYLNIMCSVISLVEYILSRVHTLFISVRKGCSLGKGSIVYWRSSISCYKVTRKNGGGIYVGCNCKIGCSSQGYHAGMPFYTRLLADTKNAKITIGNCCRLNGVYIHAQDSITIGNNCVIASGVNIIDSNGHETKSENRTNGRDEPRCISIGNNVWIGLNATILKGSIIGDNAIIAAGSVVKAVVPANTIYDTNGCGCTKQIWNP